MKEVREILKKYLSVGEGRLNEFHHTLREWKYPVVEGIDEATAEIEKLFPQWISISERLPEEDAEIYLLMWDHQIRCAFGRMKNNAFDDCRGGWIKRGDVLGWMDKANMPKLPEVK